MRKTWKYLVLAGLALSLPAFAGNGDTPGFSLDQSCSISGKMENFDPFANFLPKELNSTSFELSNSYSIQLKPLRPDDMSQYQFQAVDNRDWGAGYSSPYMWEAGRGPGGNPSFGPGQGASQMDGRAYSPIPMGR